MTRFAYLLASVPVALGASASVNCGTATCSTCVGTGIAMACVNYTAPPAPNCLGGCGTACTVTPSAATSSCQFCAAGTIASACVTTTQNFGYLLQAQSSLDAGIAVSALVSGGIVGVNVNASASGTINGNSIVSVDGSAAIPSITLSGSLLQTSFVEVTSASVITSLTVDVGTSKVDTTDCSSLVVATLNVPGTSVSFFQSCNTTSEASVVIPSIQFTSSASGNILIAGGSATLGVDAQGNAGNSSGSGTIQLAGGVSVYGNLSSGVTLQVVAAGKSAPIAVIDAGKTLAFYGSQVTSASASASASIVVNGNFWLAAAVNTVQPQIVVNSAATFTVSSTTALNAQAWKIAAQGKVVFAAGCNRAKVFVQTITQCLGTVQINLDSSFSAFASAGGTGIGFTYASSNNVALLAQCNVVVQDSTGASVTLTSVVGGSASGRRLLGSGQATWNSNQMNFQTNSASSTFVAVPVVLALVMGLFY